MEDLAVVGKAAWFILVERSVHVGSFCLFKAITFGRLSIYQSIPECGLEMFRSG